MKNETIFKHKIQKILKEIPDLWFVKIQMVSVRGIPDLLICHKGRFIAFELKVGDNDLDPLQDRILTRINKAGGIALELTPDNYKEVFDELFLLGE